ncbi:MAG TPA: MBL fold metallo-hydrolase [Mycobacteriales bacterium]|nr:MBL fold metallo-hydrolase [Mycobacteriales bacterium]
MKLTKFGHSCVRLDDDGGTLVIDPGGFTEANAVQGADAILITHEHADHFIESRVREAAATNPGLQVWTVAAVAESLTGLGEQLHVIGHGDAFTAAGFEVEAHGTRHAEIHRDIPRIANSGFLINQRLFHPGDALTVPDKSIDTLLLPVHAPWSRISDLIDWLREVAPTRALAVHDGLLNPNGLGLIGGLLGERGPGVGTDYLRIEPLDTLAV